MPAPAFARTPLTEAQASPAPNDALAIAIREEAGGPVRRFYAQRGYRPLWAPKGAFGPATAALLGHLRSARYDGLKPDRYRPDRVADAVAVARSGDPRAVARAEVALSDAFARYVRDMRRTRDSGLRYADDGLRPKRPSVEGVLMAAAFPRSLADYVSGMEWMSPEYVRVRGLAVRAYSGGASATTMARLKTNLERARALPGPWTRHVLVDASAGRLWYYEAGRQVGTMRVVVGAPETQTPMLVGTLHWAILNPYWNIPDYLARGKIAKKVLAGESLAAQKIEALSDWSATPRKLPASAIDWHAVAAGGQQVRLRELPGAHNSMGKVKFTFPNDDGIYLHDTPDRALLKRDDRHLSNGCIRLEDAAALGKWLMQRPLKAPKAAEQAVPLPIGTPVYLTYITAATTERGVAFRDDVYGRDG